MLPIYMCFGLANTQSKLDFHLHIKMIVFLLFAVYVLPNAFGQKNAPLITIPDGQLRGTADLTKRGNVTYYAYRGIPYARKPLGDLRFAPPIKNGPWNGIWNATEDRDVCTQLNSVSSKPSVVGSEDCLYINVYTTNVNGSLPVMVWIYGGSFVSGGSTYEFYAPDYFLEKNVIFVSFNYRVGVFGFLSTEDSAASGNWGLKDQILALKWVKQNIQHFGGDPNKVTIFGESAGGASVGYLLQTNKTAGLYNGAILQSGTSLNLWALTNNARRKAFSVGSKLGIIALSSQSLIRNLRQINYKNLSLAEGKITSQFFLTENALAGLPFGVVKEPDSTEAVFSSRSWEELNTGDFQRVPLIIGYTSNEAASVTEYIDKVRPVLFQYDLDVTRFAPYDLTQNWFKRLVAGTAVKNHFFVLGPIGNQPKALTRFLSVDQFDRPIREEVVLTSQFTTVYYYKFSYKGPLGDPNNTLQGVGHAEDVYYFFYNNRTVNERDYRTIQRVVTLWTNFAKTGNPTPSNTLGSGSVLGNLTWVPNDSSTNTTAAIQYLNINTSLTMQTNPFQSDWNFYQNLYNTYGDPPYTTY